jgi:hypothetical protein
MAVVWLAASTAGLVVVAPDLAAGNLYSPRVFAVTHGLTLGVTMSAIFGALHQFIPAVLGVPIRHPRVAIAGFWLSQLGTLLLVVALWRWRPALQAIGWLVLFAAVGCASWTVLPARRRSRQNKFVGGLVSVGHSALGVAMLLALARIGQGLGWWQVPRDGLLLAHLHLGMVGFGSMTALGFGAKMLPAFLGSRVIPEPRRYTLIAMLVSAGLLLLSVGAIATLPSLVLLGGLTTLAGTVIHLVVLRGYWGSRSVERLDPALGFIAMAIVWYAAAAGLGIWLLWQRPRGGVIWAAYVFTGIAGWLVHLITGVLHRIGPRLIANLRAGAGARLPAWLARGALRWPALSWLALALLGGGTGIILVGLLTGNAVIATAGAAVLSGGALALITVAVSLVFSDQTSDD